MSQFVKVCRENAGLTQEQLAEKMGVSVTSVQNWERGKTKIEFSRYTELAAVLNVPIERLIKEILIEEDKTRPDHWPGFLFDEDTNAIIDTLHLNHAQQELFGLLYIYDAEYLQKKRIDFNTLYEDLKKIPYGFIEKVGSIRFMNQVDGLHRVIKHIKTDFLMKVLKLYPETEFNIKKLPKELICEFIDGGYKEVYEDAYWDNPEKCETEEYLSLPISMRKAELMLPVLEKENLYIADGWWPDPIQANVPKEVCMICGLEPDLQRGKPLFSLATIRYGLEIVTNCRLVSEDVEKMWLVEINEKGKKLREWFRGRNK